MALVTASASREVLVVIADLTGPKTLLIINPRLRLVCGGLLEASCLTVSGARIAGWNSPMPAVATKEERARSPQLASRQVAHNAFAAVAVARLEVNRGASVANDRPLPHTTLSMVNQNFDRRESRNLTPRFRGAYHCNQQSCGALRESAPHDRHLILELTSRIRMEIAPSLKEVATRFGSRTGHDPETVS